jgi:hypothetical protein
MLNGKDVKWVEYSDYARLQKDRDELVEALKNIVGTCKNFSSNVDTRKQDALLSRLNKEVL